MAKWWLGAVLGVGGLASSAAAQYPYLPNQGQASPMTDPVPISATAQPGPGGSTMAAPGLAGPGAACPSCASGGGQDLSLPAGLPNAWDCNGMKNTPAVYFSVGYMGLQRQRLGHVEAAVLDTASGGVDTGDPPPANSPEALTYHDIRQVLTEGVRTTIGFHWCNQAIEASGFYLGESNSAKLIASNGMFSTFFNVNGAPSSQVFPLGFEGDNGMWLQADVIRLSLQTALGSAEVNYRVWFGAESDFSASIGVRYLDIYERFSFYTGDDDVTVRDINNRPDPTLEATYSVTTHNRLLAPQLGFEWNRPLGCWLAFTMDFKGAWGANFLDVDTLLKRGDGFVGFTGHRSQTLFSHMYELGFFLNLRLMDNARIKAGYDMLWAVDVAEATGQVDYNLANPAGHTDNHGSIFYGGPVVELQLVF
jgi:hypothetical protein